MTLLVRKDSKETGTEEEGLFSCVKRAYTSSDSASVVLARKTLDILPLLWQVAFSSTPLAWSRPLKMSIWLYKAGAHATCFDAQLW